MATLKTDSKQVEVPDGFPIREAAEDLGVPFGCRSGLCGTCMIDIIEGEDNLSELTQEEKDMGMNKTKRLACQCKIKSGFVKIKY